MIEFFIPGRDWDIDLPPDVAFHINTVPALGFGPALARRIAAGLLMEPRVGNDPPPDNFPLPGIGRVEVGSNGALVLTLRSGASCLLDRFLPPEVLRRLCRWTAVQCRDGAEQREWERALGAL